MIFNTNPYIAGAPVDGTRAFVGRADVLRNMEHALKNSDENAMVLYGQSCIGKTSVLKELSATLSRNGLYAPIYFDLKDKAASSLKQILWDLSKQILYSFDIKPLDNLGSDFSTGFQKAFLPHVLSQLPEKTALVLLFDECCAPSGNAQAGTTFFPYLRNLMSLDTKRIKFIFAVSQRPECLPDIYSALFDGLKFYHLPLFSLKETAAVVHLSKWNASLKWPDDAPGQIHNLTGGHPCLAQQLCQAIWERLYDSDPEEVPAVRSDDMESVAPELIEITKISLEKIWDGLDIPERAVASALAEAGPQFMTGKELEGRLQENDIRTFVGDMGKISGALEKWELIQSENDGYRIRPELLRRWIVQCKPLTDVQDAIRGMLDSAETLFESAQKLYQKDRFKDAAPLLQQIIRINPDHTQANQMLTEIFLVWGNTREALKLLESLYERNPWATRPRLIQTLLIEAKKKKRDDERLALYERVLKLDPRQAEALAERRKITEKEENKASQKDVQDKVQDVSGKIDKDKADKAQSVPEKIKKLEELYHQAIDALKSNKEEKAQELLAEVLSIDPSFREATRYMHLAMADSATIESGQPFTGPEREAGSDAKSSDAEYEKSELWTDLAYKLRLPKTIWDNARSIRHKFSRFRQKFGGGLGLIGPYKLICAVAKGGMSELFLAANEKGDFRRMVIIKKVRQHLIENSQFTAMFKQEARLAALLYHPNIVQIIDFYEEQGAIIMEYIQGRNLAQITKVVKDIFSVEQAIFIASQICKGLEHAHSQKNDQTGEPLNIVHRDIKPSNILISFNGEVKITDFGISKANSETESDVSTMVGEIKGTLAYMAPEQAEQSADDVDHRTDIYSFGIVFYEMLSGEKLRKFITLVGVAKAFNLIIKNETDSIISLRSDIPPELNRIVMKCLEKDKSLRYQNAREVNEDLKRLRKRMNMTYDASNLADFMEKHFKEDELTARIG